jgi:Glycosyl transferase family 2
MSQSVAPHGTGRIAVAVIVKNEATELAYWLAWYHLLGADTIFVFDDGSTDGTAEIAEDAGRMFDVRVLRLSRRSERYELRQRDCYLNMLQNHRDEFEWIGFFDADEYLAFYKDGKICLGGLRERLDSVDADVGAMAFHWCNYGSSGWVIANGGPSFATYVHHADPATGINRHVKSFVRPGLWCGGWMNVHKFDVGNSRYVYPNGRDVQWERDGITLAEVDWTDARVMHFQLRSMEHFVDRMKKRMDLVPSPALFDAMDYAEMTDLRASELAAKVLELVRSIDRLTVERVIAGLSVDAAAQPSAVSATASATIASGITVREVVSDFGHLVALDTHDGLVSRRDDHPAFPLACLTLSSLPDTAFLLWAEGPGGWPYVEGDFRTTRMRRYLLEDHYDDFSFRNPETRRILGVKPPENGGAVIGDVVRAQAWERFRLRPPGEALARWLESDNGIALLRSITGEVALPSILPEAALPLFDMLPIIAASMSPARRAALVSALGATARRVT